jgi:mannose-6-phosphate isomerase-like protein (cupin superfamily)
MLIRTLEESAQDHRGGQVSFLLHRSTLLAVTWVEGAPRSEQPRHAHEDSEQVYVILEGAGLMKVGDERREVRRGMAVVIAPGEVHSIENVGGDPLVYVSATAPPFKIPSGRWEDR